MKIFRNEKYDTYHVEKYIYQQQQLRKLGIIMFAT